MSEHDNSTNRPHDKLRDGALEIALWKREGKHGEYLEMGSPRRRFQDAEGNWKTSHSLSRSESMRSRELMRKGEDRISAFSQRMKEKGGQDRDRER